VAQASSVGSGAKHKRTTQPPTHFAVKADCQLDKATLPPFLQGGRLACCAVSCPVSAQWLHPPRRLKLRGSPEREAHLKRKADALRNNPLRLARLSRRRLQLPSSEHYLGSPSCTAVYQACSTNATMPNLGILICPRHTEIEAV